MMGSRKRHVLGFGVSGEVLKKQNEKDLDVWVGGVCIIGVRMRRGRGSGKEGFFLLLRFLEDVFLWYEIVGWG